MTTKKKAVLTKPKTSTILLELKEGKSKEYQFAEFNSSPTVLNAITSHTFTKFMGEADLSETIGVIREKVNNVNNGNLNEMEATLTAQAVSLNAMFTELARRAALNMGTHMQATESYMRLALKAQSQCARTIEVLAAIKNPPVVFAKQANISHGHQQVNNSNSLTNTLAPTHTEKQ